MAELLNEHLKRLFEGMGRVLVISTDRVYVKPLKTGFMSDVASLRGDARKVSLDLTNTTKKYSNDESSYQR
jgi:hypothetical protein